MLHRNIKLLSIFNFLIGFSLFSPLAILYFSKVSGSYTLGTSIFGVIMLASALLEVPTGVISDKVGRKYTIILGSWSRVLSFIFYALGYSYWWLIIGAVFEGASRAFYSGNNDALLFDTLADNGKIDQYEEYNGKVSSSEQLAMGISALFGSLIASFSFNYLLWFSVLIQVFLLIISYFFINPKSRNKVNSNTYAHISEAVKLFIQNKKLRLLSLTSIIDFSISELKWQFGSAFTATVWPIWAIGISKMLPSFGASLSFYFSGKLIHKFKAINILLFDSIYGKVSSLIAYTFPTVFSPIIMSTSSLLFGVSSVSKNTLLQNEFTDHQRATMSSLNSLGGSVGFFLMSFVLGGLADSMGSAKALIILSVIGLPVIYLYWMLFRDDKKVSV